MNRTASGGNPPVVFAVKLAYPAVTVMQFYTVVMLVPTSFVAVRVTV